MPTANLTRYLMDAIFARFAGIANSFTGGYWRDLAPENQPPPYVVTQLISAPATQKYGGTANSDALVQFKVIAPLEDTTVALMDVLLGQYDDQILTLTTGRNTNIVRVHEPIPLRLGRDQSSADSANNDDIWQVVVTFRYTITP